MITFKQFLTEGGKATEKYGTTRATKADIASALAALSKLSGVSVTTLEDRLLGSTRLTYLGHQKDSGDIDVAFEENEIDIDAFLEKLEAHVGHQPRQIGNATYSVAFPVGADKKVQVDVMLVPDVKWAKFSHHASEKSAHKSGVRNELLHSALKFSLEPGKDIRVKDPEGNDLARASRSYKLIDGVERIFKVAPKRKDGKGRVKSTVKVSAAEVKQALDELGVKKKFSDSSDLIRDPDVFAELLFGPGTKASDLESTEQLIELIKKKKGPKAPEIFKDAVKGMKRLKFPVPTELQKFEQ